MYSRYMLFVELYNTWIDMYSRYMLFVEIYSTWIDISFGLRGKANAISVASTSTPDFAFKCKN